MWNYLVHGENKPVDNRKKHKRVISFVTDPITNKKRAIDLVRKLVREGRFIDMWKYKV